MATSTPTNMDKAEIKKLVLEKGLTITDLIDVVVDINGYIGVGLISLGDGLKDYCYKKTHDPIKREG